MEQRTYELVYVMRPDATEQQVADLHAQVQAIVTRMNGTIGEKNEAGMAFGGRRKLAYEIGHHKEGLYVLEVILGNGALVHELDRRLKVTEGHARFVLLADGPVHAGDNRLDLRVQIRDLLLGRVRPHDVDQFVRTLFHCFSLWTALRRPL